MHTPREYAYSRTMHSYSSTTTRVATASGTNRVRVVASRREEASVRHLCPTHLASLQMLLLAVRTYSREY